MKRIIVAAIAALLVVACQDLPRNAAPTAPPSFAISEARTGGNQELFFAAPLATTPQPGDPNFDVGQSNALLRPYVRICVADTTDATAAGCTSDVTAQATGSDNGLEMTYSSSSELYQANWQTKPLDPALAYRIEIWGIATTAATRATTDPRWLFGWRDIANAPSTANCTTETEVCLINYGQSIPVKVRIEQFAFCPAARNCAAQFVSAGTDANLVALLNTSAGPSTGQLFIPGQTGTDFAIALSPCTDAERATATSTLDLPTFGPCLRTSSALPPDYTLTTPATVSWCGFANTFGLSDDQWEQLKWHHITDDLTGIQALPEVPASCGTPTSGTLGAAAQPGWLRQMAERVGEKVFGWVEPRPLLAKPLPWHDGGGGQIFSYFVLALGGKSDYGPGSAAFQQRPVGSQVTLSTRVTDLLDQPVEHARVHWRLVQSPGGASDPTPLVGYTDADGIAQTQVTLSTTAGNNVYDAYGRGIADRRETGCTVEGSPAACNGPRSTFDPFHPFDDHFDSPALETVLGDQAVPIADGTRLRFTVYGCAPGHGSATVDGVFSAEEWECANKQDFTASVSGGSAPATVYWMNDNTTLYLAVRVQRSSTDRVNGLQFNFDNNGSCPNMSSCSTGAAETGDDVLSLTGPSALTDAYLTAKCSNSSQSSCWSTDTSDGGTNDGMGAVANDGTYTTYEISHPIHGGDTAHDLNRLVNQPFGFFLTLQVGNGAQGNTQWPGFRQYLETTAK